MNCVSCTHNCKPPSALPCVFSLVNGPLKGGTEVGTSEISELSTVLPREVKKPAKNHTGGPCAPNFVFAVVYTFFLSTNFIKPSRNN